VWLDRAGAPAPADVPTIATLDDLGL